ncbi:hypothetical protein BS50DRAFT_667033 [Corynespora cassiicola Philippines]|uniref:Uncharacterized protein n=1 Tax=Corynespora cassiicola Philippines TaxID=1448308 RepID=A0A2T2NN96_CORCC|nr:hypothetical protein BS50DRAFT_667033 [Corynespora cassiicola Philippines]
MGVSQAILPISNLEQKGALAPQHLKWIHTMQKELIAAECSPDVAWKLGELASEEDTHMKERVMRSLRSTDEMLDINKSIKTLFEYLALAVGLELRQEKSRLLSIHIIPTKANQSIPSGDSFVAHLFFPRGFLVEADDDETETLYLSPRAQKRFRIRTSLQLFKVILWILEDLAAKKKTSRSGKLRSISRDTVVEEFRTGGIATEPMSNQAISEHYAGRLYNTVFLLANSLPMGMEAKNDMRGPLVLKPLDHLRDWFMSMSIDDAMSQIDAQFSSHGKTYHYKISSLPGREGRDSLANLLIIILRAYEAEVQDEAARLSELIATLPKYTLEAEKAAKDRFTRLRGRKRKVHLEDMGPDEPRFHLVKKLKLELKANRFLPKEVAKIRKRFIPTPSNLGIGRTQLGKSSLSTEYIPDPMEVDVSAEPGQQIDTGLPAFLPFELNADGFPVPSTLDQPGIITSSEIPSSSQGKSSSSISSTPGLPYMPPLTAPAKASCTLTMASPTFSNISRIIREKSTKSVSEPHASMPQTPCEFTIIATAEPAHSHVVATFKPMPTKPKRKDSAISLSNSVAKTLEHAPKVPCQSLILSPAATAPAPAPEQPTSPPLKAKDIEPTPKSTPTDSTPSCFIIVPRTANPTPSSPTVKAAPAPSTPAPVPATPKPTPSKVHKERRSSSPRPSAGIQKPTTAMGRHDKKYKYGSKTLQNLERGLAIHRRRRTGLIGRQNVRENGAVGHWGLLGRSLRSRRA